MTDQPSTCREILFPQAESPDLLEISDERSVVLLDPLRWRVLEAIGSGKTIGGLSDLLQVTDARLLYHLQQLVDANVVRLERTGSSVSGWRCFAAARRLRVRVAQSATEDAGDVIPASVASDFNQAARELREGLYGQGRQVSVNHNRSRLSEDQAAEFNRRLLALIEEFFPPGKGDRSGIKYGFHGVCIPIDLHSLVEPEESE